MEVLIFVILAAVLLLRPLSLFPGSHSHSLTKVNFNSALFVVSAASMYPKAAIATEDILCYYPDGSNAELDYPYSTYLNNTSGYKPCCIPTEGDQLVAGNLCYFPSSKDATQTTGDYIYRGSCTDMTFNDDSCPKLCLYNTPNRWERLEYCGGTSFCCQLSVEGGSCCAVDTEIFDYDPGEDIRKRLAIDYTAPPATATEGTTVSSAPVSATEIPLGYPSTSVITSLTSVTISIDSNPVSITLSHTISQSSTSSASASTSAAATRSATNAPVATPSSSTPSATAASDTISGETAQQDSNKIALGVGIGLGVPTAGAALIALWWTFCDRKEKRRRSTLEEGLELTPSQKSRGSQASQASEASQTSQGSARASKPTMQRRSTETPWFMGSWYRWG